MDPELYERLLYKLHEAEALINPGHTGPSRFCRECRARVEYLAPIVQDYLDEMNEMEDG